MRTRRVTRTLFVTATATAIAALGACGGTSSDATADPSAHVESSSDTDPVAFDTPGSAYDVADMEPIDATVATARGDLAVFAEPGATEATSSLPAKTSFGSPTTVFVLAENDDVSWYMVALPTRPNGSTGFIRAADVDIARVDVSVDIDLAAKHLQVLDADGNSVIATEVAIGSAENPTPTGAFYLTDVVDTGNPGSAYGPYALGLSAHSETLSEFGTGDGQIAIHGTNQPSSIGQAVSHGCVRIANDVIEDLAFLLPLGTPVRIH